MSVSNRWKQRNGIPQANECQIPGEYASLRTEEIRDGMGNETHLELHSSFSGFLFLHYLDSLSFHFEANSRKQTHVDICHPYQSKACNKVPSPVWIKKFESRNDQKRSCDIVAEAVLARK